VAIRWIRDGAAERLLHGVQLEARARRALAAEILPLAQGAPEAIHVWLDLPAGWDAGRVQALAASRGLSLVAADSFAAHPDHPDGLRISLGGPANQKVLREALAKVADLLAGGSPPQATA
jgi:DNA-binding transcriptional MocR family regulator